MWIINWNNKKKYKNNRTIRYNPLLFLKILLIIVI